MTVSSVSSIIFMVPCFGVVINLNKLPIPYSVYFIPTHTSDDNSVCGKQCCCDPVGTCAVLCWHVRIAYVMHVSMYMNICINYEVLC